MGVQKASSNKNMKKSSKLDSLKNIVLGSSKKASVTSERSASEKPQHSSQANHAAGQKKSATQPQASKTQGKAASHPSKASGKSKTNAGPSSGHAQKATNKSAAAHTSSKTSSPKAAPATKQTKTAGQSLRKVEHGHTRLDLAGETVCREVACEGLATSGGYCRLHYIKNWKKIKRKELILREKKLNQYIEELVAKYPDKYIEAIRQDLASDKDFAKVIYDLDLDEGVDDFDIEGSESVDSLIDTIKREFDDEGETF